MRLRTVKRKTMGVRGHSRSWLMGLTKLLRIGPYMGAWAKPITRDVVTMPQP